MAKCQTDNRDKFKGGRGGSVALAKAHYQPSDLSRSPKGRSVKVGLAKAFQPEKTSLLGIWVSRPIFNERAGIHWLGLGWEEGED